MAIELLYGRGTLAVEIPQGIAAHVINKQAMPVLDDPAAAIDEVLAPLGQLATGRRSACILICDITRPVPNHLFLRPLIRRL
ncbi:MAG: DUF2088 domain-containing protein, partial [Geminicoccaceae bacterium]|nr:DUF2088 domain-containing protein [Geminicoccaceae bacterium]